jgi:hypothetical protein
MLASWATFSAKLRDSSWGCALPDGDDEPADVGVEEEEDDDDDDDDDEEVVCDGGIEPTDAGVSVTCASLRAEEAEETNGEGEVSVADAVVPGVVADEHEDVEGRESSDSLSSSEEKRSNVSMVSWMEQLFSS